MSEVVSFGMNEPSKLMRFASVAGDELKKSEKKVRLKKDIGRHVEEIKQKTKSKELVKRISQIEKKIDSYTRLHERPKLARKKIMPLKAKIDVKETIKDRRKQEIKSKIKNLEKHYNQLEEKYGKNVLDDFKERIEKIREKL